MAAYKETVEKHRRLAILRYLSDCAEYTSNASILTDILDGLGIQSSRSQVVTSLVWLRDNSFVTYEDNAQFIVVSATLNGVEIAQGRQIHPEIQRPRPSRS